MTIPYRTEVVVKSYGDFLFDQEYWMGLAYRHVDWAFDTDAEIAPFQVHTKPSAWTTGCQLGSAISTAPFLMYSSSGNIGFITYGNKVMWQDALDYGVWHKVVVHFVPSFNITGYVEVWKDGVYRGRVDGANSPALDRCGQPMRDPVLKLGVYKWNWQEGRPATGSTIRQIYIDSLKLASGPDGYDLVDNEVPNLPPPDINPPTQPQNFHQTGTTQETIDLAWDASNDDLGVAGYKIYQGTAAVPIDSETVPVTVPGTNYQALGLTPDTLYSFQVSAYDNAGHESERSSILEVRTNAGVPASEPVVSVTPSSLSFPSTTVGNTSGVLAATLENTGTGTLDINGISFTPVGVFARSGGTCGASLAAGSSCTIGVTFTPSSATTFNGDMAIANNATGSPHHVSLSGTGVAEPMVNVTPSLPFPSTTVGSTSGVLAATLENTGTGTLDISGISFTPVGVFARSGGTCGASLAAGSSCTIGVTFTPSSATTFNGDMAIANNATGSPHHVALSGTGVAALEAPAGLTASSLTSTSMTISWNSVANASSYTLQRATDSSFSSGLVTMSGINKTSSSVTGLRANVRYFYRVLAVTASSTSPYSSALAVYTKPNIPGNVAAANGASGGTVTGGLTWSAPAGGAASYSVQWSNKSSMTNASSLDFISSGTQINVGGSPRTVYMRVRSVNADLNWSGWSATKSVLAK